MGKIFIRNGDGYEPLTERVYSQEDKLQEFIFENPNILGLTNNEGKDLNLIPIAREVPVSDESGSTFYIDLVCLDSDGIVNIIEVKRCSDTRIRREVVGQIMDYSSQLCYTGDEKELRVAYESNTPPEGEIEENTAPTEGMEYEEYWETVKTNLQAGKVRMIIASDGIPSNMKRIIEFLNSQMDTAELIGVDLHKFGLEDFEVLTTSVIGKTEESRAKKERRTPPKRKWDRISFLNDIETKSGPQARSISEKLIQWCEKNNVRIWWGEGYTEASFITVYDKNTADGVINNMLFGVYSGGKFYFQFQYLRPPFDSPKWKETLMSRFNEIDHIDLKDSDMSRRPSFFLTSLDDTEWEDLLKSFNQFIEFIEENQ